MSEEISGLKGCGTVTTEKLSEAGLGTLMSLAVSSPDEVSDVAGISTSVARKLIKQARENLKLGFEKAKEYSKKRKSIQKIPTGCKAYDDILNGGFESGAISEVYGPYGSGKTQLSHLLVIKALQENKNNKAIYIDTEGTFRDDRIKDFAEANGVDINDALDRIYVSRAYNTDHQMLLVDEVEKEIQEDNSYRILIVDSLTSHFRSEYIGRGALATRQQKLNKHMHQLLKIADIYNMIVIVTNQVMSDPAQYYGDPTKPIGGHIVGHNCIEENSIIYATEGLMKIKEKPKKVFTLDFSSGKCGKQKTNTYTTQIKKVKRIFANNILEATNYHRFPIRDKNTNTIIFKMVKDLKKGDDLIIPKKINFEGEYQYLNWKRLDTYNYKRIKGATKLTENLAYFLGVLLGDGYVDKRSISIRDNKKENLEIVRSLVIDLFGIDSKIKKVLFKNAYALTIHSKELVNNIDIKHNKDLWLNIISKSPSSVRMSFISGMIDTDGSLQREIDISQADKSVLDYIQGMLLFDGIQSIIREQDNNRGFSKKNGKIYHLRIRSCDCKKLAEKLVMKYDKRINLAKYFVRKTKGYYKTFEWEDFMTFPITKIEDGVEKMVIDLNVNKHHTFIVNGISSHNSTFRIYMRTAKQGTWYAKLVDSPNLKQSDCNFLITCEGFKDV